MESSSKNPYPNLSPSLQDIQKSYSNREKLTTILTNLKYLLIPISELSAKYNNSSSKTSSKTQQCDSGILQKIDNNQNNILTQYSHHIIVEKLKLIPLVINFCYTYYIQFFNSDAPFYQLPTNTLKLQMILSAIHATDPKYQPINTSFANIIRNTIISDICNEMPPYYMRNDLSIDEAEKVISLACVEIKNLLTLLLTNHIM